MDDHVLVYIDLDGTPIRVGQLWTRSQRGKEGASFEYHEDWLSHPRRFSLEPALRIGPGSFHTQSGEALFGALGDSAPDRWGRVLMRRAERRRAEKAGEAPKTLKEIDYLLLVGDEARQGALRFATKEGGPFLAEKTDSAIPPLVELPRLLDAADHVNDDTDDDEDLRLLLAPGSSLGGARPKASVMDQNGHLSIAKFPNKNDEIDTVRWEGVALSLAEKSGITVPDWRIEIISGRPVIIVRRFDREGAVRIPFVSAMSMIGARDHETRSYLELVDALRQYGARARADMHALWRRIVFSILISNTDDHLRNHGFLCDGPDGWHLSPAYDLNPVPVDLKPRVLSTAIDLDDGTASLDLAFSVAEYFELGADEAAEIAIDVGRVTADWRSEAVRLGLGKAEINRMASAFEHNDLRWVQDNME
jgi:serine/threonine-protein kinase HipA